MEIKEYKSECKLCGYTASGKFSGDLCPRCGLAYWECAKCGFTMTVGTPLGVCPKCGEKGDFVNITCYTPQCGCALAKGIMDHWKP